MEFVIRPPVENDTLDKLFDAAWPHHTSTDFQPVLNHSLLWVCAYDNERLVGFVNVAWDGGIHGFLLDTTVHPDYQRQGTGVQLVKTAVEAARSKGMKWLHVDYEPHLEAFYQKCGFRPTLAGLIGMIE